MNAERPLRELFRQMLALLEGERQALAAFDLDRILTCANGKLDLCERIEVHLKRDLDDEARGLLDAITRQNEVNRKLRNLIAANVESRLGALTGRTALYAAPRATLLREAPR